MLLTIASGFFPGVLAYLILALIIPAEGSVTDGENAIKANIADMRDTSARLGEDVRARFSGQEGGTGEQGQPDRRSNTGLYILGILLIAAGVFFFEYHSQLVMEIYLAGYAYCSRIIILVLMVYRRKR